VIALGAGPDRIVGLGPLCDQPGADLTVGMLAAALPLICVS